MEEVIKMRSNRVSVEIDVPITPDPSDSEDSEPGSDSEDEEEQEKDDAKKFARNYSSDSDSEDEDQPLRRPPPKDLAVCTPQKAKQDMTDHEKEMDQMFDILLASPSRAPRAVG